MVEQQTWVTLAAALGVVVSLASFLVATQHNLRADLTRAIETTRTALKSDIANLDDKIDTTRTELKSDIANLDDKIDTTRTELKSDIADVRAGVRELEHRTYDLARQKSAS